MPVSGVSVRPFEEADRADVLALGKTSCIPYWWITECPHLHLVSNRDSKLVAHLMVADRSFPEPSRRVGECEMRLTVAREYRRQGLGSGLLSHALEFVGEQKGHRLSVSYLDDEDGGQVLSFLTNRGFEPFERYCPSHLDLALFDPARFADAVSRVTGQGIRLCTLAELGDTEKKRRELFELECRARSVQPFREVGEFVAPTYEYWTGTMKSKSADSIFLAYALAESTMVGMITDLIWGFTGVDPAWQGRGIATALKVYSLTEAKSRGMETIQTENHEDNHAMLAINRKLGFQPDPGEVNCIRRF